jgi:hypothetical protein
MDNWFSTPEKRDMEEGDLEAWPPSSWKEYNNFVVEGGSAGYITVQAKFLGQRTSKNLSLLKTKYVTESQLPGNGIHRTDFYFNY